ncbi:MAG: aspartate-alanine antiporter [Muribaculaceae bacterium]|nr:aspartate-alanine antiporter [Muribaculaceae bacterium]
MFDSFVSILREYPALAVFLTVGAGFYIGKLRIGSFSLGSVTSVLLVGTLVGQLVIPVSGPMKMFFFMLFLFSIGYSVGPDFFKSLRGSGAKQALFAVIMSCFIFVTTLAIAFVMHYTKGETIGLFSGSQTCSSLLGVGGEAIGRLGLSAGELKRESDIIPVCYAVTYIFGTLGTVILLGNFGPKLLGGLDKVKAQTAELAKKLNNDANSGDPAVIQAMRAVAYRCFRINSEFFAEPRTTYETEVMLRQNGLQVYIDRVMHEGSISAPRHDDLICNGDEIVVCGRTDYMIEVAGHIGREVSNRALLDYPLERVGVVVVRKNFIGKSISLLRRTKYLHGVVIRDAVRNGQPLEITAETVFAKGDRITILGRPDQVSGATPYIGHVDRPTVASDLMFIGLAIFVGGLFGALCVWVGNVPLSFGTSGGSLLAGLLFGWLRSKRPTYGNISPGALWFMNNLGLNVFIAIVGIEAAPSFVSGIKAVGPMLFVAGAVGTTLPLLFGLWLGHKVFKFNPAITLGCCAGTRTCTASLGAVQNALDSTLPAIGYTVTYAVSNILLVIWGLAAVMIV